MSERRDWENATATVNDPESPGMSALRFSGPAEIVAHVVLSETIAKLKSELKAEAERADRAVGLSLQREQEVFALRETLRWIQQRVHQGHHDGASADCRENTCAAAREALGEKGGGG